MRACKSEIGLIPFLSPWDAQAPSFLRIRILARDVAIVNCPRRARQTAPNSTWGRPRTALSCLAASLCVARCWNYYSPAKNPCARAVRRKPQKPVRGVRATPRPIKAYAQSAKPFSNPLLGATSKEIIPLAASPVPKATSGETPDTLQDPFARDFLYQGKNSRRVAPIARLSRWRSRKRARRAAVPPCALQYPD